MHALQQDHIVDIFVWIDDLLPGNLPDSRGGRPSKLSNSEVLTILVFNMLTSPQPLLKGVYARAKTNHGRDFTLPAYTTFVEACHRAMPELAWMLEQTLDNTAPVRFMDSTMVEVCKIVRADRHAVAREVAAFGKNHQGWHYGFKLHASCNPEGMLTALAFTPASESDSQQIPKLVNDYTFLAVGDGGYTAGVMRRKMWEEHRVFIVSPPHPKQKRQLLAEWQLMLHRARPKIECVFDYLKQHLNLVTSFPRSVQGYFVHYLRVILAYQLMRV